MNSAQSSVSPPSTEQATPRREFLGQLATAAVALAGTACAAPIVAQSGAPAAGAPAAGAPAPSSTPGAAPASSKPHWDETWFTELATRPHKAVFDAPDVADGLVVMNAAVYFMSYTAAQHTADSDMGAVLVIRHRAIPLALNDAMWAKYDLGHRLKIKDPDTNKWAGRNPYYATADGKPSDFTLARLHERGAILLGCELALNGMAREQIAKWTRQDAKAVQGELHANVVPGLLLQASGIYAVTRAQEAGCTYMRSA